MVVKLKKFLFISLILVISKIQPCFAAQDLSYFSACNMAKKLIVKDQTKYALQVLNTLQKNEKSFRSYILYGQISAINNNPKKSLHFYKKALLLAKNNAVSRRIALFGIGKMQLWLEKYNAAEKTYTSLLQTTLSNNDRETALAGLISSLACQDKPIKALKLIPENYPYKNPKMILASTQALLWAGWPEKAKKIFSKTKKITDKIPPKQLVAKYIRETQYETLAQTATFIIKPSFDLEQDNDGLKTQRYKINYSQHISDIFRGEVSLSQTAIKYKQTKITANGVTAGIISKIKYYLTAQGKIGTINYKSWNPTLWNLSLTYKPNDLISFNAFSTNESVETPQAISNKISYNSAGISVRLNPLPRLNMLGTIYKGYFSDHNKRVGYYTSIRYLLFSNLGLSVEARAFGYNHSNNILRNGYFNPKKFRTEQVILKISRRLINTWRYYAGASIWGSQTITPGDTTTATWFEAGIRGFITKHLLLQAYVGHTNSDFTTTTGYKRDYGGITISLQ